MSDDLDPERAVIGIVLDGPAKIRAIEDLDPDDFAQPRLGALWALMLGLDQRNIAPEPVAVAAHLADATIKLDPALVHELLHDAPIAQPPHMYARRVRERAILRRLDSAAVRIHQIATADGDPDEAVELARAEVDAASRATASTITLVDQEIDATLVALESEVPPAVPTPWPDLNYVIGGWRPGALYVIGARPGVGKSLLGLQAAIALAETGHVAFHSLEMPTREVHTRLLAQMADVPMVRMEKRQLNDRDWKHLVDARARLADINLAVDDRGSVRVVDIRSAARTLARRGPLAGIVVDYLQLMSSYRGDKRNRQEQVAEWSRQLKLLAKELDCPVLALSQLNRGPEQRADKRPTMADLRESGAIEQDADVILLLHVDEDADPSEMHVIVEKNRQGPKSSLRLTRRGEVARLDPWKFRPHVVTPAATPDEERRWGS